MHGNRTARPPTAAPGPVTLSAVEAAALRERLDHVAGYLRADAPDLAADLVGYADLICDRRDRAPTLATRAEALATELARVVGTAAGAGITIDPEVTEMTSTLVSWSAWLATRAEAAR